MIIHHPLLGPRDSREFTYLGDATLMHRPCWQDSDRPLERNEAQDSFYEYLYLRDNPAGEHRELWFHEHGDRSWLVLTRHTVTHEIIRVELALDVARREGRST